MYFPAVLLLKFGLRDLEGLPFIGYMYGKPWPALAAPHHTTNLITHQLYLSYAPA